MPNAMSELSALTALLASPEADERARALAQLVQAGRSASVPLRQALDELDLEGRRLAAQGLAEIADPAAEAAYRGLLDDSDPAVRGRGAQGLAAVGADDATTALVGTIDDLPDVLHYPQTVATQALVARGWPVALAVAELLTAADPVTRGRALLVLRQLSPADPRSGGLQEALGVYADADDRGRSAAARAVAAAVDPA